jgi:hypothetical protein
MGGVATWSVLLLVGLIAVAAIAAAIVNDDSPSQVNLVATRPTADLSLCDSTQLELSIRASGFESHVAALRLSGTEPCDVGELHVTVTVADRRGERVPATVAPPEEFSGAIRPGQEFISTFEYRMRCRLKKQAPFSATVIAAGEIGSVTATAPVAFRRDPFTQSAC